MAETPSTFSESWFRIAQQRVALRYLEDGCLEDACPPLQALLHIMAEGHYRGRDAHHPEIRAMFTRDYLLASDWYRERLETKQRRDTDLWRRHVESLEHFLALESHADEAERLDIVGRLDAARRKLAEVRNPAYLDGLVGTIGADPLRPALCSQEMPEPQRKVA